MKTRLARMDDERLAALVGRGDAAAFEVLYDRHHAALLAFCRHMLGNRADGEDALQQAFVRAHRALADGRAPKRVRPWLFAIARNRCLTLIAARREAEPIEGVEPSFDGLAREVERRADLRELVSGLAQLPDDQRGALVLAELGDFDHAEIARVIGCPPPKVKALIFQARSALIADRDARRTPCDEIRMQLETARGGVLRRGPLRRHLRQCDPCAAYRVATADTRAGLAIILPVLPSAGLKAAVLGGAGVLGGAKSAGAAALGATGAAGGGAAGGGGGAAAASGGAAAAGGGAAAAGGGTAAAGGGAAAAGGGAAGAAEQPRPAAARLQPAAARRRRAESAQSPRASPPRRWSPRSRWRSPSARARPAARWRYTIACRASPRLSGARSKRAATRRRRATLRRPRAVRRARTVRRRWAAGRARTARRRPSAQQAPCRGGRALGGSGARSPAGCVRPTPLARSGCAAGSPALASPRCGAGRAPATTSLARAPLCEPAAAPGTAAGPSRSRSQPWLPLRRRHRRLRRSDRAGADDRRRRRHRRPSRRLSQRPRRRRRPRQTRRRRRSAQRPATTLTPEATPTP